MRMKYRCRVFPAFFFTALLTLCPALFGITDFYWEDPDVFSPSNGSFPVSAFNGSISVAAWQETEAVSSTGGRIGVSLAVKKGRGDWVIRSGVAGPYSYSGAEPSIITVSVDKNDRIFLAVAASSTHTEILVSDDFGETFETARVNIDSNSTLAPRIFPLNGGGYLCFVTRVVDETLSLYYSRSEDGKVWPPLTPFVTDSARQLNFLPTLLSMDGQELVVFQSFTGNQNPAFQLFAKSSFDGGRSWGPARLVTDFPDPGSQNDPSRYDNQRAHVSLRNNAPFLVWERRFANNSPQIYGIALDNDGGANGRPELINREGAYCNNPIAFSYNNETTVVWFDNRRGQNRIFMAQRGALDWQNTDLSGPLGGAANFARPVVSGDGLFLFWQAARRGQNRILVLKPDTSVNPVTLTAQNYTAGKRTQGDLARVSWQAPYDSSGIAGYSYSWTMDPGELPAESISIYHSQRNQLELRAGEEGTWYLKVRAQDFAGNWSAPSLVTFIRDTTPPPAAVIIPPLLDGRGYLLSNTFDLRWNQPPASDVAGYTWNMEYLSSLDQYRNMDAAAFEAAFAQSEEPPPLGTASSPVLPRRVEGLAPSVSYNNQDNGVWRFAVAPVDDAGNIGAVSSVVFRTNKFIPYTVITHVDTAVDAQGMLTLRIIGRGFTSDGTISRVYLDREGEEPYDVEFLLSKDEFRIVSDREITGIQAEGIDQGLYRVGLEHPVRGVYMTRPLVSVSETGTIKFGDYTKTWQPSWVIREERRFVLDASLVIVCGIVLFAALGIFASFRGISAAVADSASVRLEVLALITGDIMPSEKKKRMRKIRKRGISLRIKLASFASILVLLVVVMVSAPLYLMMTRNQEETLLKGLWDRSSVLLEGLASSARAYLPSSNILELGFLPNQTVAIPEAHYVTITGYGSASTIFNDHVWATNDPGILSKIDTSELQLGVSRLEDVLSPRLEEISAELDTRARTEVGGLSASIAGLTQEGIALARRTDAASVERLSEIQDTTRALETELNSRLSRIAQEIGSEPNFSTLSFSRDSGNVYIFFKPVMYRYGSEDSYFRGLIRLEVSVDSILSQIAQGQASLLRVIVLVALTAIVIGMFGALVFSILIIRPIKKLVSHVERIRDTEDKSKLEGVEIEIKSRDEIAVLGNTINDMTHGLVKAAQASHDLTIGKEVQKKFIPLDTDREGNKLTSGFQDTKNASFFGYYEGAKGVSGDYFDYRDLDGRYYAIIKCDVAGKGIPAALIMIQVATMFLNHFKSWKPTEKGMRLEELVYQINDFIETLAFKGRFAAFTLCLFDSETGITRFCNAGDNIIHWYDASERRVKALTLPETPATGVLPNFLVESKGGYAVQKLTLDRGDILFLYTDGIEEAKRKFRDRDFKEIICAEGETGETHATHIVGQADEEMGPERVEGIINAVMNKEVYTLRKYHNGEGEVELEFDFTRSEGKVEEAVMAMVSVEKMFRLYKDPAAGEDSWVLVDKKVDNFLKDHFRQYRTYCGFTREYPDNSAYMYYTHVKEDEQYDDITILGVNRK